MLRMTEAFLPGRPLPVIRDAAAKLLEAAFVACLNRGRQGVRDLPLRTQPNLHDRNDVHHREPAKPFLQPDWWR